jgi:hypothetical protein
MVVYIYDKYLTLKKDNNSKPLKIIAFSKKLFFNLVFDTNKHKNSVRFIDRIINNIIITQGNN